MNALGRGLASLIPRRNKDAEEMLEQIDSMEEIAEEETEDEPTPEAPVTSTVSVTEEEEEPEPETPPAYAKATAGRPARVVNVTGDDEEEEPNDDETPAEPAATSKKQVSVIEEFEDLEKIEDEPRPVKPLVTPLTMDPETGVLKEPGAKKVPPEAVPTSAKAAAAPKAKEETALWDRHERKVEQVKIADIEINPYQPRRDFDADEMEDLTQSIEQHGILQPLVVMRKASGGFQLIAGERRLRAAKSLKWTIVPCVIRMDVKGDRSRLEMALIENIQRQNLNPIEEAMGYHTLHEEYGMTHEEIGTRVGRSRVGITNILRVLQLPPEVQRGLAEGKISPGHARAILMIPDAEKQVRFYQHLLEEGLTVRRAETRARRIQRMMHVTDPMRRKVRGRLQLALKYDSPLEEKFGYNARIRFIESKNRFEVVFQAFSEKEVEELVARLMGQQPLPHNVDTDVLEASEENTEEENE